MNGLPNAVVCLLQLAGSFITRTEQFMQLMQIFLESRGVCKTKCWIHMQFYIIKTRKGQQEKNKTNETKRNRIWNGNG